VPIALMTLVSTRKRLHVEDVARCRVLSLSAEIHRELEATFDDVVRKMQRDAKANARPKVRCLAYAQRAIDIL
jgi:hypothetical protein